MVWQTDTINPASTSPAGDITKITNDLQQLRSVMGGGTDAAIPSAFTKIADLVSQALNKGTTGGTSTAYTLTPAGVITAYSAGQSFWVTFHTASGASPTLQISGVATPPALVRYNSAGALVAIGAGEIPTGFATRVTLLSATQALIEEMPPASAAVSSSVQGAFQNLRLSATGSSSAVAVTADGLVLRNSSNQYTTLTSVNLASLVTGSASGSANSLDTGAWANSTWYYVYVIWNGTTTAGLFSLSATAPTLPSGYTYFARVGAIRTQAATNFNPLAFRQAGRKVRYVVAGNVTALPQIAGASVGNPDTPTWVSQSTANVAPPTIAAISVMAISAASGSKVICAPSNAYGAYGSTTNPPPVASGAASAANVVATVNYDMVLETANTVFWASNVGGVLACTGWEDNL